MQPMNPETMRPHSPARPLQTELLTNTTPGSTASPITPAQSLDGAEDLLGIQSSVSAGTTHLEIPSLGSNPSRPSDGNSATSSSADDDTAPSSTTPSQNVSEDGTTPNKIERLIQNTRIRLSTNAPVDSEVLPVYVERDFAEENDHMYEGQVRPLVYGYLYKLGRNGKWQRRFFETDGECLTYYKTDKRVKMLASLDLFKVGAIAVDKGDPSQCTFVIEVADRPYALRADSKPKCKDWVITLNRIKEARLQLGHVKLVKPDFHHSAQPPDLLDTAKMNALADDLAPRVVLSANRQRTRAVNDDGVSTWEQLLEKEAEANSAAMHLEDGLPIQGSCQSTALARWVKPRTVMTRIRRKLMKWAQSIRGWGHPRDAVISSGPPAPSPSSSVASSPMRLDPSSVLRKGKHAGESIGFTESKDEISVMSVKDSLSATREIS